MCGLCVFQVPKNGLMVSSFVVNSSAQIARCL